VDFKKCEKKLGEGEKLKARSRSEGDFFIFFLERFFSFFFDFKVLRTAKSISELTTLCALMTGLISGKNNWRTEPLLELQSLMETKK
jgi:hypothetical protein